MGTLNPEITADKVKSWRKSDPNFPFKMLTYATGTAGKTELMSSNKQEIFDMLLAKAKFLGRALEDIETDQKPELENYELLPENTEKKDDHRYTKIRHLGTALEATRNLVASVCAMPGGFAPVASASGQESYA